MNNEAKHRQLRAVVPPKDVKEQQRTTLFTRCEGSIKMQMRFLPPLQIFLFFCAPRQRNEGEVGMASPLRLSSRPAGNKTPTR